jgi:hypothetical protein
MNRTGILATVVFAGGLLAFATSASADTIPGFAAVIKSPSSANNWQNAYEHLTHTTSGTDGVAYNLPIDITKGTVSADVYGSGANGGAGVCAQLLSVAGNDLSVYIGPEQCDWPYYEYAAATLPTYEDGWAAIEVSFSGVGSQVDSVSYGPT